jgi:Ni/Fe-hydrogenase subunit HybB-like protein
MIQRIQTIWLLLASLLSATMLMDWYTGYVYKADIPSGMAGSTVRIWKVTEHFPSLIIVVVMMLVPLLAIFMFKNRKKQRAVVLAGVLACMSFTSVNLMHINNLRKTMTPPPVTGSDSYMPASVMPAVVLVFMILAITGIRKDEKLVRSMDRLR